MQNKLLDEAIKYLNLGFSIIPVGQDKKPLIQWKEFQNRKPTEKEVTEWFSNFNITGIGIVTGKISGLIVLDAEKGADFTGLKIPTTPTVNTGGGGVHYYFKLPENFTVKNSVRFRPLMDIRGEGGFVVAPPSLHPSGKYYEWAIDFASAKLTNMPKWLTEALQQKKSEATNKDWAEILKGVSMGERNETATSVAGKLLAHFPKTEWESVAWPILKSLNLQNTPPLPESELRTTFKSIADREISRRNENVDEDYKEGQFNPLPVSELMKKEFKDTEWIVDGLIPSESIIAISGAPASYKTWLILDMAIKIATGNILFDKFVVNQTGVLLIDEESGERLLQNRFKKFQNNFNFPIHTISLMGFKLTEKSVEDIIKFCKSNNIKLIIFDSLVRIHSADENDAMKMSKVFTLLKKFVKEGLTVIFTHHNRKTGILRSSNPSQDMRGSSDILASVDCHLAINRNAKEDLITVNQTKLRQQEEMKPFKLNVISDENEFKLEFAGDVDEIQSKKSDIKEAVKDILGQENKPMYKKELSVALKDNGVEGGYSTFKKAIAEMVEKGEIFEKQGEKNKIFCSLHPFELEKIEQLTMS